MDFVKNDLRNRLDKHLDLCVRMKTQRLFSLETFPFGDALAVWRAGHLFVVDTMVSRAVTSEKAALQRAFATSTSQVSGWVLS